MTAEVAAAALAGCVLIRGPWFLSRYINKNIVGFVNPAHVLGGGYMAQPSSPGMMRRCHPTLSLRPMHAKSWINAHGEARGSRFKIAAVGGMRAAIAWPKR